MLDRAAADRFLVFDLRPAGLDRQVVFQAQPVGGDLQMDLALTPEHELMGVRLMHDRQRRVFLAELGQRRRQLHLVIAILHGERQGEERGRRRRPALRQLRFARCREQPAGGDIVHAGQRHHLADAGTGELGHLMSLEPGDAAHAAAAERHAVGQLARQHARERKLAGMGHVIGLEHLGHRIARLGHKAQPRRRGLGPRHLMAQRLQQAAHAIVALGGAEEDGDDEVGGQILAQLLIDLVLRGHRILEQLLQQLVVVVGERFQQLATGLLLARGDLLGHLDQLGGLARLVAIGALADEIDIAGDDLLPALSVLRKGTSRSTSGRAETVCSAARTSRTR